MDESSSIDRIDRLCKLVHDLKEEDLNNHKQKIEIAKRRMAREQQQSTLVHVPPIASEGENSKCFCAIHFFSVMAPYSYICMTLTGTIFTLHIYLRLLLFSGHSHNS